MTEQQRSLRWIKSATPEQIDEAMRDGQLDSILAGRDPGDPLTDEEIAEMSAEDILAEARTNPALAHRLGAADQGARGEQVKSIIEGKTADEIAAMLTAGQLDDLLRGER